MFSDKQKRKNSLSVGWPVLKHILLKEAIQTEEKEPRLQNARKENPGKGKYEQKLTVQNHTVLWRLKYK